MEIQVQNDFETWPVVRSKPVPKANGRSISLFVCSGMPGARLSHARRPAAGSEQIGSALFCSARQTFYGFPVVSDQGSAELLKRVSGASRPQTGALHRSNDQLDRESRLYADGPDTLVHPRFEHVQQRLAPAILAAIDDGRHGRIPGRTQIELPKYKMQTRESLAIILARVSR